MCGLTEWAEDLERKGLVRRARDVADASIVIGCILLGAAVVFLARLGR